MISVELIKFKSHRFYKEVLQNAVTNTPCFPRVLRTDKSLSKDFSAMSKEIAAIMNGSKDRLGYGYKVLSEEVITRQHGKQNIPSDIIFETLDDYLRFIGKIKEYYLYQKLVQQILSELPELSEWIIANPLCVIEKADQWDGLLKVCRWFIDNDYPDSYYIRQLPIQVHTKFIESNQSVLSSLLDFLVPEKMIPFERTFEKRYRLKFSQPLVRLRFIDTMCEIIPGITDISVPLNEFKTLKITASTVFITENLMNFLIFPNITNSILIWGAGFAVENLNNIPWLDDKRIIYWGDLDNHGMQILSQLRYYYPRTESLMMDRQTLDDHKEFWVKGKETKATILPKLTPKESELFAFIKEHNIRLEQERITHKYLLDKLFSFE